MKQKLFKYLSIVFGILLFFNFLINTHAFDFDCETIEAKINTIIPKKQRYCHTMGSDSTECIIETERLEKAIAFKNTHCVCKIQPFSDELIGPGLDQSGYVIHKYIYNGSGAFCVEPNQGYRCYTLICVMLKYMKMKYLILMKT